MHEEPSSYLDGMLRLRLAQLSSDQFERFFLGYLNSGISLTIKRNGRLLKRRVISAVTYGPGSGRDQGGIDLRLEMEGREVWAVQCKRVKSWNLNQTEKAIERAEDFAANHNFLAVACDPSREVQDEIDKQPRWTLWNLDTICRDFRDLVPAAKRRDFLPFLNREEVKRFLPHDTNALITPAKFFERFTGPDKPLRHDWALVGRDEELKEMATWDESGKKVLVVTARGGEGKTRVIREFCERRIAAEPGLEVLFLNPLREDDDFSLGLNSDATRRLIIIDDAHRAEQVPVALLGMVQRDEKTKLILASRPQGQEAIISRLYEVGIGAASTYPIALPPFKKSEARLLAKAILGDNFQQHLEPFIKLTEGNPFLVATAGNLLREDRLKWGAWGQDKDFRRHVFQIFETENLKFANIPDAERLHASRLLRLLAILSPVEIDADFLERAGKLVPGVVSMERLIQFLKLVELVVGPEAGLRVSPDLFADFLVYETCFAPENREPVWTAQVLDLFEDHTAALIRNFSEASWIAHLNGVDGEAVLAPLFKRQCEQFVKMTFLERQGVLRYWTTFSQYLPKLSLDLAKLTIDLVDAPPDNSFMARGSGFDTHDYTLKQLPALLRPVAKYHYDYAHLALDILWELGRRERRPEHNNQNHPWTVITEAFKFDVAKPIEYNLSALNWLDGLLKRPNAISELEGPTPVLRLFLEPCFSRVVDASYVEGRTIHFVEQHVNLVPTQPVRDGALKILDGLIERGPVMAVLDALSALEVAIQRSGLAFQRRVENPEAYALAWRPERLKALERYRHILAKYPDLVIRYEIRHTLKRGVIFEEDKDFGDQCREIMRSITNDLPLRTAVALTSDHAYEFEDSFHDKAPDRFEQNRELWNKYVESVAAEVIAVHSEGEKLYQFLFSVVRELTAGGYSLALYPLLGAIGRAEPQRAVELAHKILEGPPESVLLREWTALIDTGLLPASTKFDLFEKAVEAKVEGARVAIVRQLAGESQAETLLDVRCQKLLLEVAAEPDHTEAIYLYQLIEHSSETNLPWAFELFHKMTENPLAPSSLGSCLRALMPFQPRKTAPPPDLVIRVFNQLVPIPDLGFFEHGHVWQHLTKQYPLETYELIRARIEYSATDHEREYTAVPHAYHGRFCLPELNKVPAIHAIVKELWQKVLPPETEVRWRWVSLFQAVVFEDDAFWRPELIRQVRAAATKDDLLNLAELIHFEGSLIVFFDPEVAELFLTKASEIGGQELFEKMRANLYIGAGPRSRGYTNGVLDEELDYVEAAATKAAESHAEHPILGPFYRWIVEVEQKDRMNHQMQAVNDMANL